MRKPLVIAFLSFLLSLPAFPQDQAEEAARRTIAAIENLLRERPSDPTLWFYLSRFQSQAGDARASVDALEKVVQLGEGFLPARDGFERVWNDDRFRATRARLEAKLARLDYAPTAFELEDRLVIPEGIAYDAPSKTFFVGSIAQHRILRVNEMQNVSEFAGSESKLDAVLGLAVDAPRRILYAVSTTAVTRAGEARPRNTVVAFEIDTHRQLRRYDIPDAKQLNDVAVAPGGRVFVSDSSSGAVYELPVKTPAAARVVLPAGQFRGTNGLAVSADAKRLYIAHSTGLGVIDIDSGVAQRVVNDTRENIAAIDGLYAWQGQLIGVENVTNPGRVVLITLSPDGGRVTKVQTMLSHHHTALYEPTTGAVTPNGFFLLAATGVSHYNRDGVIEKPDSIPQPAVVRIPLPR
jgi:SMP-30/gluconolaconase/LRE-like protein